MKHFITSPFSGLSRFEQIEYSLFLFLTVAIAIDWHLGLWGFMALTINTIVKTIATHQVGNPCFHRPQRIGLILMMVLYAIYAISTLYSANPGEAWSTTMVTMLPLLLLPAIFLASNLHYLTPHRRHLMVYLLAATLTIRFFFMAIRAAIRAAQGIPLADLIDFHFDPLHHNYLALYLISAVAFLYPIVVRNWHRSQWHTLRWIAVADMVVFSLYMVIMGSRSGLLIEAALCLVCILHLAFVRHQWRATLLLAAALFIFVGITYLAAPRLYWRIVYSAQQMAAGNKGDSRQTLWACGLEVLNGHEVLGLGCDGYWQQLHQSYVNHNFAEGFLHEEYNTHNQYLETTLATGLVGLITLLAIVLLPAVLAFRHPRNLSMLLFTIVYAGSLFFEVSLARQMGLLFICWWYGLWLLPAKSEVYQPSAGH
ncbi:MAG: O-antigen ligase family protein [Bacteroidales bacterium]|nr:O-antigen ligase family protein [Bacteroidales bacterium]